MTYFCAGGDCGARFVWKQNYGRIVRGGSVAQITDIHPVAKKPAHFSKTHGTCCPHCGNMATIQKTARIHPQIAVIYYRCTDVSCGTRFTCDRVYSHMLNPGVSGVTNAVQRLLNAMTPEQLRALQKSVGIAQ
ncbi:ogr/Delta-like zinc finger family protein [Pectobacterium odoriferum]|uniref:ogr/Delta-like zinc finger family protein n=1 Tax=Pectobacterium odoriferum TaxID=78398 RepID=UPI00138E242D|nr:ogr/Delta-like zinc finger family protein [Pectobacterium odoriferum]